MKKHPGKTGCLKELKLILEIIKSVLVNHTTLFFFVKS